MESPQQPGGKDQTMGNDERRERIRMALSLLLGMDPDELRGANALETLEECEAAYPGLYDLRAGMDSDTLAAITL